jgi:hypothetical protein
MAHKMSKGRAALVIAHPGHELRVYHWLTLARPTIYILTDGSGNSGTSRLGSTAKIIEETSASTGSIFGYLTDQNIYSAIMNHDFALFIQLVEELAQAFLKQSLDYVVGDAIEGYNPAHDVCRFILNAAIELANHRDSRTILNYDILLTSEPADHRQDALADTIWFTLDDNQLQQKLQAAYDYTELDLDVNRILKEKGIDAVRTECLRPASTTLIRDELGEETPYYEIYGEKRVAAGYYQQVLRYREHVLPLVEALRHYVCDGG